jgi:hypothetical protein
MLVIYEASYQTYSALTSQKGQQMNFFALGLDMFYMGSSRNTKNDLI